MSSEANRLLSSILFDMQGRFRVSDLINDKYPNRKEPSISDELIGIEHKGQEEIDQIANEIHEFLVNIKFADGITNSDLFLTGLGTEFETPNIELTETGKKLRFKGSYKEFIGLPLYFLNNIFSTDFYYWWVKLPDKRKKRIKEVMWALIVAIPLAIIFALLFR